MKIKGKIDIVGGVDPLVGSDLFIKICKNTVASKDSDHLPIILVSLPSYIPNRVSFLDGKSNNNPVISIFKLIKNPYKSEVNIIGIPCNTAHNPEIFNVVNKKIKNYSNDNHP